MDFPFPIVSKGTFGETVLVGRRGAEIRSQWRSGPRDEHSYHHCCENMQFVFASLTCENLNWILFHCFFPKAIIRLAQKQHIDFPLSIPRPLTRLEHRWGSWSQRSVHWLLPSWLPDDLLGTLPQPIVIGIPIDHPVQPDRIDNIKTNKKSSGKPTRDVLSRLG